LPWLKINKSWDSIVTSIPDMSEVNMKIKEYTEFFRGSARLCLEATKNKGYCIFLQTDRKYDGWFDKSYLIIDEAKKLGYRMLWHKIALRTEVGKTDLYRPTFSHMLCFSKEGKIGIPIPDVIYRGDITYDNAFGIDAVVFVLEYLKKQGVKTVVDPFVGSGTTLAIANKLGMKAIGLDIDKKQCEKALYLQI
jgi:hypothetical protein